jgi:hypothetical protein
MRMATLSVLVGMSLYLLVYYYGFVRRRGLPAPFAENEIGILVAPIPGDDDRRLQQTYAQAIRALSLETSQIADVAKVRLIERSLANDPDQQHEQALKLGRWLQASFVLRAVRVEGGFQSWITIIQSQDFARPEAHLGKVNEQQLAEIDTLPLPRQITLLAQCAFALSLYRAEKYDTAALNFREIVTVSQLPPGSPARPFLVFLLGNSYLRGRFCDPATLLPLAVGAYDDVLKEWSREANPNGWIDTISNRAVALLEMRFNVATHVADVERTCGLALSERLRSNDPNRWARLQMNRAAACLILPAGAAPQYEEAVAHLSAAQSVVPRRKDPYLWATITRNRGLAHSRLYQESEDKKLQPKADTDLRAALRVFKRSTHPYDWGITIMNLAFLYIIPPDPDRMEQAGKWLDAVDMVFSRDAFPVEWAILRRYYGAFFWVLSTVLVEYLQKSIGAYEAALEVFDPVRYPMERARTLGGLSVAGFSHGGRPTRAGLELALRSAEEAAQIYYNEKFESDAKNAQGIANDAKQKLADMSASDSAGSANTHHR